MASYLCIANDVQWAAILCALPVPPQTFLKWNRLERLAFLTNLAREPQWRMRPYVVKIFGQLLQLPYPPQVAQPGELVPLWSPISRPQTPGKKKLMHLEHCHLVRRRASISPRSLKPAPRTL